MTYELHPEIRRFWESLGYSIGWHVFDTQASSDLDSKLAWIGYKYGIGNIIALTLNNGDTVHYFDGTKCTEQEMLRIIKLTAFL